jgi:glycosyltransferase involved in cell wall biosynthesis
MKSNKLKILLCSEASFINSGFGIYAKELLSRLYDTNKYELAEFASYGFVNDPRDSDIKWRYYANAVKENDPRHQEYQSRTDNQFGRWRFEKVLLDFKPDVVVDIRDYWMSAYQALSPLRKYFHWVLMPTVDSAPQQEEWIDTFIGADAIFTYSDWGAEVLNQQSSNKIKYINTVSPGVDLNIFKPQNRLEIRNLFDIPQDAIVVGSVMRNQKRKLIPELFSSFRAVLDELEKSDDTNIGKRMFLYLHTSFPDMGWDIPELLKEHRLSNKVLFTYLCRNCGDVSCSVFSGPQKVCKKCLNKASTFPSVTDGVKSETLSQIYNIFDLYVQYSICEGFGMPQVEAGACGVPIATVNYSAMCDIVRKLEAYPIKVRTLFKELETKAMRAFPDNQDLKAYILDFVKQSTEKQKQKRIRTAELTRHHYDWNNIISIWEEYFDNLAKSNIRKDWSKGDMIKLSTLTPQKEDYKNNFDKLLYLCNYNMHDPSLVGSYRLLELLNHADYGFVHQNITSILPYDFKNIYSYLETVAHNNNSTQEIKQKNIQFDDDFIRYAHLKLNS